MPYITVKTNKKVDPFEFAKFVRDAVATKYGDATIAPALPFEPERPGDVEIAAQLCKIESDERLHYPPADVFSNAPLALIQTQLETEQRVLRWILGTTKTKKEKRVTRKK